MGIVGRLDQYASMLAGEFDDYSMSENLFLYSEQYNQTSWVNTGSTETANTTETLSPNGFNTAEKLIGNNGVTGRQSIYQDVSCTSGTTYTFSVFLKQAERRYATIWFDTASISEGAFYGSATYLDLQTGTVANSNQSTKIVAYPNGWYRCYVTATPTFTGTLRLNTSIGTPNNAGDTGAPAIYKYTGDGVSGIYIWGGQLETGTSLTDYTPTTTTAKTRVLSSTTNTNITGLSTYFSSGFSENVGAATTLVANVFPPYDPVYDDFGGTLFGAGQGRYMRQNTDKSVIVYNEIDEVSDFRDIVKTGLVLDLDAAQPLSYKGTGTAWNDLSGIGNNATLTNSPTYSTSNQGYFDFASASSQYATAINPGSLTRWTVETVVRFTAAYNTKVSMVVGGQYNGASSLNFAIGTNNAPINYNIAVGFFDGAWRNTTGISYAQNTWFHITGTYDGSTIKQFTNGTQVDSLNYTGTPTSGGEIRINRRWDDIVSSGNLFDSNIAMVRIYNRALTTVEIAQNFNAIKHRFGL